MMNFKYGFAGFLLGCLLAPGLFAEEDALSIVRAVDARQHSETGRTEMTMITYPDMHDESNRREFTVRGYSRGDDESYTEFLEPRTIRGLRILARGDDNWVYFPSTGRTRKIAGKSRKESVQGVGGDFSYEDLGGGRLEEKYSFRLLASDADTWTLEGISRKPDSVYSKIVLVVARATCLPIQLEFHTEEDGHLKDLVLSDVRMLGGRETATRLVMTNRVKESKTEVLIHAAEYDIPVDDRYFNPTRFNK